MSAVIGASVTQGATYASGEDKEVVLVACGVSIRGPNPDDPTAWARDKWMSLAKKLEQKVQRGYCERLKDIRSSLAAILTHPHASPYLWPAYDHIEDVLANIGVERTDEQTEHETCRDDALPRDQGLQRA